MKRTVAIVLLLINYLLTFAQGGGSSLTLNGTSSYISAGNNFKFSQAFTIELWANLSSWNINSSQTLVSCYENGGFRISVNDIQAPNYRVGYLSAVIFNGTDQYLSYPLSGMASGWHHIAISYNGSIFNLYIDGFLKDSKSTPGSVIYNSSNSLLFGAEAGSGTTPAGIYWKGSMDEIRIWNTALSPATIRDWLFQPVTSVHPNVVSLAGYYKCDEGSGTAINDYLVGGNSASETLVASNISWAASYIPLNNISSNTRALWSASGVNTTDTCQGLYMQTTSSLSTSRFEVFAGNGLTGTSTADLPSTANIRSSRIWQFDRTGNFSVIIKINLNDPGLSSIYTSGIAASQYKLLYRSGTTGAFSLKASGTSIINNQIVFNTSAGDGYYTIARVYILPTISTNAVTNISSNSATCGGNITSDGGIPVTSRGVCWNTTGNPTTANSKTVDGAGTGVFTSALTNLATFTTYYVRAYAVNTKGTQYGSQIIFTTSGSAAGQSSNIVISNLTFGSATFTWTRGAGTSCIAFLSKSTMGLSLPADNTAYTANSVYGTGSQIGTTGWYCIYNGTGNSVNVTGLSKGNSYRIHVCEYVLNKGKAIYNTIAGNNNPINFTIPSFTTWNGSAWDFGVPDNVTDAVIAGNYTIGLNDVGANLMAKDITVNTGDTLFVGPQRVLSNSGSIIIDGALVLQSNANGDGSLLPYGSITGNVTIQKYLAPQQWHLVTSPVSDATASLLIPVYMKPYNESADAYGSYILDENMVMPATAGYAVWSKTYARTISFTGDVNTGNITSVPLTLAKNGYNLIGNPFPSAIDWESNQWGRQNISNTIWVWNGTQYATYTAGVGATNGGSRYLAIGQGFFVQTFSNNNTLGFSDKVRVSDATSRLKSMASQQGLMRIKISGNGSSDECLIAFRQMAGNGFDQVLDGKKLFGSSYIPQIYSVADAAKLAVNILNDSIPQDTIPLQMEIPAEGNYSLSFVNTTNHNYSLFDSKKNLMIDISGNLLLNETLTSADKNRFLLVLKSASNITLPSEQDTSNVPKNQAFVSTVNFNPSLRVEGNNLYITGLDPVASSTCEVVDLNGRIICIQKESSCVSAEINALPAGLFMLKIENGSRWFVQKFVVY